MVFFTCNACGASLKKNQVEKHYQNECPNCEVLSCLDCGRDFFGDEYASHTKCISEAEKYQGSLYKESGKGGPRKGERKQQEWLEKVKQSVSASSFNPRVARLLERIAEYPNIPRKKAKFENFVKNSCNVRDQKTLSQLWDIFSGATQQQVSVPLQKQDECRSTTDGSSHLLNSSANLEAKEQSADCCEKKKKRKRKEKGDMSVEWNQDAALEWTEDAGTKNHSKDLNPPEHKKKKKHRNKDQQDSSESHGTVTRQSDSHEEDVSGASFSLPIIKKRKRKHKHKGKDVEENDVDTVGEGVLQRASGTKAKQHDGAEVQKLHKLPRMNGVDEKDQEVAVLAVGEHSSWKRKHKVTRRDSAPLCIVPDDYSKESEDIGDSTHDQSVAKRLKVDSSVLGVGKAKKSKHKHRHKL